MFSVEQHADAVVITPQCDLDARTRETFAATLRTAAQSVAGRVVVSMQDCGYADSSALNALIVARRLLGDRLALAVAQGDPTYRIFSITNFDQVITMYDTIDEALMVRTI